MSLNILNNTDVIILCGGRGSRLKSFTKNLPKPLIKIGNRPFLDILIAYLSGFGLRRFILALGYKADIIHKHYSDNNINDLKILFSREKEPLGTGGAIKNAQHFVRSDYFLVLNGDSFYNIDFSAFLRFCLKKKVLLGAIALKKITSGKDYGAISIDPHGRILSFDEKNMVSKNCFINGGVYIFKKTIFSKMPEHSKFSLEKDLFPKLTAVKGFYGYKTSGFFIDIGTPQRLKKARKLMPARPR
jgi:NDP-sugar pyrophosphorylase family protein